jgi:hypothetical protein
MHFEGWVTEGQAEIKSCRGRRPSVNEHNEPHNAFWRAREGTRRVDESRRGLPPRQQSRSVGKVAVFALVSCPHSDKSAAFIRRDA